MAKVGDLETTGALVSANVIVSRSQEDFHNSGTIAGRRAVVVEARDIQNIGGRIAGGAVALEARRDINVIGGTVSAALSLLAKAGNDVNVISTTSRSSGGSVANGYANTVIDRVGGLLLEPADGADGVSPGKRSIVVDAARNIELRAAHLGNAVEGASTDIMAGGDIVLSTLNTASEQRIGWDAKNHLSFGHSQEVGTQINTLGKTQFNAGGSFNARAAQVQTTNALEINAGKDVNIAAGEATQTLDSASFTKKKGLFSSRTITSAHASHQTLAQGSTLGADTVTINAKRNILVQGSQVISDNGTTFDAGHDIDILETEQTETHEGMHKSTRNGLFGGGGGIGFAIGSQRQSANQDANRKTAAASTVGSIEGDVKFTAGNRYRAVGSDVLTPEGGIDVKAKRIEIVEARESGESSSHTAFKQSGLSVSISTPLLSVMQTASSLAEAAGKTSDTRMQALAAGTAALNVYNNREDLAALAKGDVKTAVSISATLGSSQSQSDSTPQVSTGRSSRMQAGGNVVLMATGAGKDSHILVRDSDISGGKDTTLSADGNIDLLASEHRRSDRSTNRSSSAGIGVAANIGQGGTSLGITANASKGQGRTNSDDVTYGHSHVTAGRKLTIDSGGNTRAIGAVLSGQQVVGNVGGNLTIESLQDTSQHAGKQQSLGGSVTLGAGFSGSASYSNSRAQGDHASVTEQSGIQAGAGGFQINVKGHTHLEGGVIASSQEAVDQKLNSLVTRTLTETGIENHSQYQASGVSLSGGFSIAGKTGEAKDASSGKQSTYNPSKTGIQGTGAGVSSETGSEKSITRSAISAGQITITDEAAQLEKTGRTANETIAAIDRDALTADGSNGLGRNWNVQALMKKHQAHADIMRMAGQEAGKAVADVSQGFAHDLQKKALEEPDPLKRESLLAEAKKWDEGGAYRTAAHAAAALWAGGLPAALATAAAANAAQPLNELQDRVATWLENTGVNSDHAQVMSQLVTSAFAVGAGQMMGGASGAAMAGNVDFNNRQLHPSETQRIKELAKGKAQDICKGDPACLQHATVYWADMLERAAESRVDAERASKNQANYQQINAAAEKPGSEASVGVAQSFFQHLTEAESMLDFDAGKIIANGRGMPSMGTDGKPQTYFSATQEQRNDPYGNVFPGGLPNTQASVTPGKEGRDEIRLERMNAINGQAEVDTRVEEFLIGVKIPGKTAGSAIKLTERTNGIALPGTAKSAEEALLKSGGMFDGFGRSILDLKQLTNDQKRVMGELFGENLIRQIVPDGKKLARIQGAGTKGIDDLYQVNRPDVDYLVIEYKFVGSNVGKGSHKLEDPLDGKQASEKWITGSNRLKNAVDLKHFDKISFSIKENRYETWVVTTRPDGSTIVEVLDASGRPKPVDSSNLLIRGVDFKGTIN